MPRRPNADYHDCVAALKPWLDNPVRVTPDEARALKASADAGDASARETLTRAALPYALQLARQYHQRTGFDLDECVAAATFGAAECVQRFDPDRGTLLTFVNCRMRSLLPEARRKAERGTRAAPMEIAFDRLADRRVPQLERAAAVREAIDSLPPRLRMIAELHYLDRCSYAEIGRRIGLTRERVRQLNVRGARMLRRALAERLDGYEAEPTTDDAAAEAL